MNSSDISITVGLFATSELYPDAFDKLILSMTRDKIHQLNCRVKCGLLLLEPAGIGEVHYGPATQDGRHLVASTEETSYLLESRRLNSLFRALSFTVRRKRFDVELAIRTQCELITFSSMLPDVLEVAVTDSGLDSALHAIATGPASRYDVYKTFWESLLPRYVVIDDQVLEMHEYSPIELDFRGNYEHLVDIDRSDNENGQPAWGYFTSFDDDSLIVEERFDELTLPPNLPQPRRMPTERRRSPTETVLTKIPERITKQHKQDDSSLPAFGRLQDDPISHWPDPDQVYNKLSEYSLKRGHPDKKWVGFASIGFYADRPGDLDFLSYALCSGLSEHEFTPFDIRVTSDGTLQFATDILLPLSKGGYHSIRTAWHAKDGQPLSLSSAYLSSGRSGADVTKPPASVVDNDDWETLLSWLTARSTLYGNQAALSMQQAAGLLWLPHSDKRTKSFASWYRRKIGSTGRVFNRRRFGGRCTLFTLDLAITSATEVVGAYRMAQVCLGVSGICAHLEVRLD